MTATVFGAAMVPSAAFTTGIEVHSPMISANALL